MDITTQFSDKEQLAVVTLTGSLDVSGAAEIDSELKKVVNKGFDIAIDLSNVSFISSQGTRVLVITSKAVIAREKVMYLIGPRAPVQKALIIMGVDKIIRIFSSMQELCTHRAK